MLRADSVRDSLAEARRGAQALDADGHRAPTAAVWSALVAVWIVWGSTFLAIRLAVRTLPPFASAGIRFLIAGVILYVFAVRRGDRHGDRPTRAHWVSAFVIGGALLLGGNGMVMWAEQTVQVGIAALIIASAPLWMALLDRVVLGRRLSWPAVLGLALGFGGLILLVSSAGSGRLDPAGAAALLFAALSWAAGSLYARHAPLPKRPLVGTGMEMIAGGLLLTLVGAVRGEIFNIDIGAVSLESALGLGYLIVFGSLVGFASYVWLLRVTRTTLVSTYAYINPVVAVLLGWAFLSEPITVQTLIAGSIIVVAVALIVTARPAKEPASST